ncbi:MAG TPA: hypothetical protein VLA66_02705, partial [Thermoanaerobaculia bacterium]|nr:hypothetical protein [Thermoanaerobaculia bacterium]
TNEARLPTQSIVRPVEPEFVPIVTVTSDRTQMATDNERGARIQVRAVDPVSGASVPNLTVASMTTNIGGFGSQSGPMELEIEFFGGVAQTVFFPGTEPGTATIRAEVNGGVDIVMVRVVCPSEGCGGGTTVP